MVQALVLAAGKGVRMCSAKPKVLQPLLGEYMLLYVLEAISTVCKQQDIAIVLGHGADEIKDAISFSDMTTIYQEEQLGTGHALQVAWNTLKEKGVHYLLVVNGDVPLLNYSHLSLLLQQVEEDNLDIAFITAVVEDTAEYGLVLRDANAVQAIVEAKDFDPEQHGESYEINTGVYVFNMERVEPLLSRLENNNRSGEFYITDLIRLGVQEGLRVEGIAVQGGEELLGVNTPLELVEAEEILRENICLYWLMKGVHIHNYVGVSIAPTVEIEPGATIYGPCTITGNTSIGANVHIEPNCIIHNTTLEDGVRLCSFSHLNGAIVGKDSRVGPYARLRPESILHNNVRIGNFVEIKKSTLGADVAVNHLSYLGNATVGEHTNIGAGTITCNYDGSRKHNTTIGSHVFVGSITALIAPLTIGDHSTIGAGSVITKNVDSNTLALSRSEQKVWNKK